MLKNAIRCCTKKNLEGEIETDYFLFLSSFFLCFCPSSEHCDVTCGLQYIEHNFLPPPSSVKIYKEMKILRQFLPPL